MINLRNHFKDYRYIPSYEKLDLLREFVRYDDVISLKDKIIKEAVKVYNELGNSNPEEFEKKLNQNITS
jgi:hypothetical protein